MITVMRRFPDPARIGLRGLVTGLLLATTGGVSAMGLDEALMRTVDNYPAIEQSLALYDFDLEAGALDRASRRLTVTATGFGSYANTKSSGVFGENEQSYSTWGGQIEARQPLFRLDWSARRARADALTDSADEALRERRNIILIRIAERYFAVLDAQEEVASREDEARAVRESLEDTRKRYEVELIARTDVVEAQARDDLAQAQLLSAQRNLDNARDALRELTGPANLELPRLPEDVEFPPLKPAAVEEWERAAVEGNPLLAQLRQRRHVALADQRSSRSGRVPQLDLVARAGIDDSSDFDFGQRTEDQRISLELTLPIYAGGQLAALQREADAGLRVAEAELKRVQGEVERDVRQRFRAVESSRAEVAAFGRALESARAAQQATANGYEAGTRTITDLLDAASRVANAQRDFNATRHQLLLNMFRLKEGIGALDRPDFQEIDQLLSTRPRPDASVGTPSSKDPS